jgi:cytochrome P450
MVDDWHTDWDHHDPQWVADPFPIWDELRQSCPVAHTGRYNEGVWLPTRYEDIMAVAHDTATFSSAHNGAAAGGTQQRGKFPPIHYDPPEHHSIRRALLPFFNPKKVAKWEPAIQAHCDELVAGLAGRDSADVASEYAAHIPAAVIAMILGIPAADGDTFRRWIHELELGDNDVAIRDSAIAEMGAYFGAQIQDRIESPKDDLISYVVQLDVDGERLDAATAQRVLTLQLVAGIDTTWGVLGASLWHLATTPSDRDRLVAEPDLLPTAIEELLRAYASVSLWRTVTQDATVNDVEMAKGDTVMMAFPAACRDPEAFDRADEVIIDREQNRHVAFGAGIHRCLGSNLARLELTVGIRTWLQHFPTFELAPDADVTWAEGQIRGPRSVPVLLQT